MNIYHATPGDVPAIKFIANQYKNELGFVNRAALLQSIEKKFLLVARLGSGEVVGFVEYNETTRGKNKGYSVIYHAAVRKDWLRRGVGRMLVHAVPAPIRLKVTTDNPANLFYQAAGFKLARTERGRKRELNVYEMNLLCVHVQGNNRKFPAIAAKSGMAYGTRSCEKAQAKPFMLDINWKNYNWSEYLEQIEQYEPVSAMIPDYTDKSQRRDLYRFIRDLRNRKVYRIMVCPKFVGAVAHIPSWCVVAISIPSSHAGFIPPMEELAGRRVHLLGGSPIFVRDYIVKLRGSGVRVLSYDYNVHEKSAQKGAMWINNKWLKNAAPRPMSESKYYGLIADSGRNIRIDLNAIEPINTQPRLI